RQPAGIVCVLWTAVMLLPGALSTEAPHFLRTAGILPAPMYLAASAIITGVDGLGAWARRYHHLPAYALGVLAVGLALTWGASSATYDYFVRWAPSPIAAEAFQADALQAGLIADRLSADNQVALSAPGFYRGLPVPLGMLRFPPRASLAPQSGSCLIMRADRQQPMYYVLTTDAPFIKKDNGEDLLQGLKLERAVPAGAGGGEVMVYHADPGSTALAPPGHRTKIRLGDAIEITGYDFPSRAPRGEEARLLVYWRLLRPGTEAGEWQFFSHIVDRNDAVRASDYQEGCPPDKLRAGDEVVSAFPLSLAPEMAEGTYRLVFGRFERHTGQRLAVYDGAGRDIGKSLVLARLRVTGGTARAYSPQHPVAARLGQPIELVGYDLSGDTVSPDRPLDVTLYWRAGQEVQEDYTVFVQLLDETGQLVSQHDGEPQNGAYPTSLWGDGETIPDQHQLVLPANLPAQKLQLIVGMYDLATGRRLPLSAGDGQASGDHLALATVSGR
ncbi:MAG: hypothetical protein M1370_00115, partial [Bacteroidetes bacterium]|nr:hypothetical protein [Bacteroidota bacterium]